MGWLIALGAAAAVAAATCTAPSQLFPRAADLPAGPPPSGDAALATCAFLLSDSQPSVEPSLFLAAIGEARDKGPRALETFAYRYREGGLPPRSSSSTHSSRRWQLRLRDRARCADPHKDQLRRPM